MSDKKLQRWYDILSWTGSILMLSSCLFSIPAGADLIKWPLSVTFMAIALSFVVIGGLLLVLSNFFLAELEAREEVRAP